MEFLKQIHLFKKGFVIFLKGDTFLDFIENRLGNYRSLARSALSCPNSLPPILEDLFSIRFKPHQVVAYVLQLNLVQKNAKSQRCYKSWGTLKPNGRNIDRMQRKSCYYWQILFRLMVWFICLWLCLEFVIIVQLY